MPRRLAPLFALVAMLAVVACNSTLPAPALTDPKDILTKTVLALKDVKTVDAKGELTGTFSASGTAVDLKGTTLEILADLPSKKARASANVPALMNTSAEFIGVDNAGYFKVLGPLAAMLKADPSGKYTKVDLSSASGDPSEIAVDPQKAIDAFKAQLDKLPSAPTKGANEVIGGQDCYHVTITVTDQDVKALGPSAAPSFGTPFTVNVDVWTRTNDLRPAKLAFTIAAGSQANVALTFTMTYDAVASIAAPPADQITP
jgi:hypothetical protein